jgi:hypothetical protein
MDYRREFLLRLYDNLWRSIDRADYRMLQMISFYAIVLGAAVVGAETSKLDPLITAVLVSGISFWGINVSINAGKWFERNRLFVINVEKEFLNKEDIGKILPEKYHEGKPRKHLSIPCVIHTIAFLFGIFIAVLAYWRQCHKIHWIVWGIISLGLVLSIGHWIYSYWKAREFAKNTDLWDGKP